MITRYLFQMFSHRDARGACLLCAVGALAVVNAQDAQADAFDSIQALDRPAFLALSENLAAATHYKGVTPAESLGILGLDFGVEYSSTRIDEDLFDEASSGDFGAGSVTMPRLHVYKGLPFGIDIGAFVGAVPDSDLTVVGAEFRVTLIEGDVATPAVSVRASYSRTQGITDFDLDNAGLELTLSKGVLMFTPYAGIGIVASTATPSRSLRESTTLEDERFNQEKVFVGLNLNLVGVNLTAEADRTGDFTTYSGKLGIRF